MAVNNTMPSNDPEMVTEEWPYEGCLDSEGDVGADSIAHNRNPNLFQVQTMALDCKQVPPKIPHRKDLSVTEKLDLLKRYDDLIPCNQRKAAAKLLISQSTLCRLLRERHNLFPNENQSNPNRKRKRCGKNYQVEDALFKWFSQQQQQQQSLVTRANLMRKASEFAKLFGDKDFKPTDGWLSRWKNRRNVTVSNAHGKKKALIGNWVETVFPELTRQFEEENIYIVHEIGLYYRALPISFENSLTSKAQKDQVTILLASNLTGTMKKKLLVIGNVKNPPGFRGSTLPVSYKSNTKAWMTAKIFVEFLQAWDAEFVNENRKILLLLESSPIHPKITTRNIQLAFLPTGPASQNKPLDLGIVQSLKYFYRHHMRKVLFTIFGADSDTYKASAVAENISFLDVVHMLRKAWDKVTPSIIASCFKKAGFLQQDNDDLTEDGDIVMDEELKRWIQIDNHLPVMASSSEEDTPQSSDEQELEINFQHAPSGIEIRNAIQVLRRNLELRGGQSEDFDQLYKVEDDATSCYLKRYKVALDAASV